MTGSLETSIQVFLQQVDRRLERLAALQADWDREGALPLDRRLLEAMRQLLVALAGDLASLPYAPRSIVPAQDGTVALELLAGDLELTLHLQRDGRVHYDAWSGEEEVGCGSFPVGDVAQARSLVRWFCSKLQGHQRDASDPGREKTSSA